MFVYLWPGLPVLLGFTPLAVPRLAPFVQKATDVRQLTRVQNSANLATTVRNRAPTAQHVKPDTCVSPLKVNNGDLQSEVPNSNTNGSESLLPQVSGQCSRVFHENHNRNV